MHGQRVGAHAVQRIGQFGHHPVGQLRQPDVADQQDVGREFADLDSSRVVVVEVAP